MDDLLIPEWVPVVELHHWINAEPAPFLDETNEAEMLLQANMMRERGTIVEKRNGRWCVCFPRYTEPESKTRH